MPKRRRLERVPEPEVMSDRDEARAYGEGDFRRVNLAFARRLARHLPSARGTALDIGTGPADIPVLFCRLAPGWRVTAVDMSRAMLRLAERAVRESGLEERIRLVRADAKDLSSMRQRFDFIFSNSLLHHLTDPVPFWHQVRRISKRGCTVVVMDLRRPSSRGRARDLVRRHATNASPLLKQLFRQSLLAAFTPAEVRRQLAQAGLPELAVRVTTDRHMVIAGRIGS